MMIIVFEFLLKTTFPLFPFYLPLNLNSSQLLTDSLSDFKLGKFQTCLARLDQDTLVGLH